jgi:hypothetical protein
MARNGRSMRADECLFMGESGCAADITAMTDFEPQAVFGSFHRTCLEPISKSPEEDNEASELYEAEEVLGVVFPTDEDAALPLNPSKEALHEPASHIAA